MTLVKEWMSPDYLCRILTGPLGQMNGYVGLPKDHPDWNKGYDNVGVSVHGGLTFSQQGEEGDENFPNPDLWWFGFDTAHSGDWRLGSSYGHKWTLEEMIAETEKMATGFAYRDGSGGPFLWKVNLDFSVDVEANSYQEAVELACKSLPEGGVDGLETNAEIIEEVQSSRRKD